MNEGLFPRFVHRPPQNRRLFRYHYRLQQVRPESFAHVQMFVPEQQGPEAWIWWLVCGRRCREVPLAHAKGPALLGGPFHKSRRSLLSPRRTTMGRTGFTTEFGMGSGVAPYAKSPTRPTRTSLPATTILSVRSWTGGCGSNHGLKAACRFRQRFMNAAKRSAVSTGQLSASLPLHFRPINHLVLMGSLSARGGMEY